MFSSLKISHKGLILVAIPLLFELVFLCALILLLREAETAARQEAHAKAIVAEASTLGTLYWEAGSALIAYKFSKDSLFIQRYDDLIQRIFKSFSHLEDLTAENKDQHRSVKSLEKLGYRILTMLSTYRKTIDHNNETLSFLSTTNLWRESLAILGQLTHEMNNFIQQTKQRQNKVPNIVAIAKTRIYQLVLLGFVLHIFIALFLALYFSREITQRLGVLVNNTKLLAQNKPLQPVLSPGDEISQLDVVFHEMAQALATAAQAKKDFVATVTHELRNPLTALQMTLCLLAEGHYGKLSEEGKIKIKRAEHSIARLVSLVNELLDIEKMESGKLELELKDILLSSVIEQAVESIQDVSKKAGISLVLEITDIEVLADEDRLFQVLVNLLSNAIKFSPPGSTVKITSNKIAQWAEVRITDQGAGISANQIGKIFDRFEQAKKSAGCSGTGLGLAISKAIIEGHGGTIGADSHEGKGSCFWFRILSKQ